MTIKDILRNDIPISFQCIEVNGEQYDECKHGDLIHIDTEPDLEQLKQVTMDALETAKKNHPEGFPKFELPEHPLLKEKRF